MLEFELLDLVELLFVFLFEYLELWIFLWRRVKTWFWSDGVPDGIEWTRFSYFALVDITFYIEGFSFLFLIHIIPILLQMMRHLLLILQNNQLLSQVIYLQLRFIYRILLLILTYIEINEPFTHDLEHHPKWLELLEFPVALEHIPWVDIAVGLLHFA